MSSKRNNEPEGGRRIRKIKRNLVDLNDEFGESQKSEVNARGDSDEDFTLMAKVNKMKEKMGMGGKKKK